MRLMFGVLLEPRASVLNTLFRDSAGRVCVSSAEAGVLLVLIESFEQSIMPTNKTCAICDAAYEQIRRITMCFDATPKLGPGLA